MAVPYFTMQFVEGKDLAHRLHQKGRLALKEALPLLEQIASALDYAHSQGVIHRDIKPANILLHVEADEKINVQLVDFGIARALEAEAGARLTRAGMLVGTPEYMSPEQAEGRTDIDGRSDAYALGVVAYEMLTGRTPFGGKEDASSALSVLMRHVRDQPPAPRQWAPELAAETEAALLRALSKSPSARFSSCSALVQALVLSAAPTTAVSVAPLASEAPPWTQEQGRRSKTPSAGMSVLLIAGAVGAALIIFSLARTKNLHAEGGRLSPGNPEAGSGGLPGTPKPPSAPDGGNPSGNTLPPAPSLTAQPADTATAQPSRNATEQGSTETVPVPSKSSGDSPSIAAGPDFPRPPATDPLPSGSPSSGSDTAPQWILYRNEEQGYSLEVPREWKTTAGNVNRQRREFQAPQSGVLVAVESSIANGQTPLASWRGLHQGLQQKYKDNYTCTELITDQLDRRAAALWRFRLRKPGAEETETTDIGAVHNGRGYALLLRCPTSTSFHWQETFAHIRASFHFL